MVETNRNMVAGLILVICVAIMSALVGWEVRSIVDRAAAAEEVVVAEEKPDSPICVSLDGARAWRALPWQDEEPYRLAARGAATVALLTLECNATGTVRRDRVEPGTTYVRLRVWRPLAPGERRGQPDPF